MKFAIGEFASQSVDFPYNHLEIWKKTVSQSQIRQWQISFYFDQCITILYHTLPYVTILLPRSRLITDHVYVL